MPLRRRQFLHWLLTFFLLVTMATFLALLGWALAGVEGVLWCVVTGALVLAFGPRISARRILRAQGAREVHPAWAPGMTRHLVDLSRRAGLPSVPRLHLLPTRGANAFAVGRPDRSAVAVSPTLVQILSDRELRGVLAHEVSHIRHKDTYILALAQIVHQLSRTMSHLGWVLLFFRMPLAWSGTAVISPLVPLLLLAAPVVSSLLELAISRTREFAADLEAARLTGDPIGLATALEKLDRLHGGFLRRILPVDRIPILKWLSTHPESGERIRRLLSLTTRQVPEWRERASLHARPRDRTVDSLARILQRDLASILRDSSVGVRIS